MIDWDSCVLWLDSKYFSESYWWDRSRYRNDGVVHGAVWRGNGLYFDGSDDYVNCGHKSSLNITNTITIEVWVFVNHSSGSGRKELVNKKEGFGSLLLSNTPGSLTLQLYQDGAFRNVTGTRTNFPSGWYHLVGTFNGTEGKVYVNGEDDTDTDNTLDQAIDSTNNDVLIGSYGNETNWLNGTIGIVRIYNKALTGEEIKILYNLTYRKT